MKTVLMFKNGVSLTFQKGNKIIKDGKEHTLESILDEVLNAETHEIMTINHSGVMDGTKFNTTYKIPREMITWGYVEVKDVK